MAYVISAHSFKMRYPEFVDVPSTQIEFAIEDAATQVDSTWGIYEKPGMLRLTAHIVQVQISRSGSATGQPITSESFPGVVSVTYASPAALSGDALNDLSASYYGVQFKAIRDAAVGSVAVV
jgi:hypothetical protein